MTNDTNDIYDFLRAEGLTYRGTLLELSEKITAFLIDGTSDSMARASEMTKSLQRLIDIGVDEEETPYGEELCRNGRPIDDCTCC